MDENLYPVLTAQVAARIVEGQVIIVLADSGNVTVLNELGTSIWKICDGMHSVGNIVQEITTEYEVEFSIAMQDATEFIQQMVNLQALELRDIPGLAKTFSP
jgi:hypothetical protein